MESETPDNIECFKEGDIINRTKVISYTKKGSNIPININRIPLGPPLINNGIENGKIYLKVYRDYQNFKEGEEIILDYHKYRKEWAKYNSVCFGYEAIINVNEKDLENRLKSN